MNNTEEYKMQCLARYFLNFKPLSKRRARMKEYFEKQKKQNGEDRANKALAELKKYMQAEHVKRKSPESKKAGQDFINTAKTLLKNGER